MKKLIIAAIYLLPLAGMAQGRYTIKGQILNSTTSEMAYLRYMSNSQPTTDSAEVIDGKFTLTSPLHGSFLANLSIKHQNKTNDILEIYLEPKEMKVTSPTPFIKDASITGSPVNEENIAYLKLFKPLDAKVAGLNEEWMAKTPEEQKDTAMFNLFKRRDRALDLEYRALRKKYYLGHFNTYIGLIAYASSGSVDVKNHLETTAAEFYKFSPEQRETDLGKQIDDLISAALKTKNGVTAMDFTQNDVNGKPVKLSDLRGKYVLLDFWASWCVPCRAETPVLVKAYARYKNKNFTILSVSLDKPGDSASWLKAIEKDGMTWTNVSDLRFWKNEAAQKYGITSIPANFLLDPSGKIIAKNLRGEQVEQKLAEILK